MGSSLTQPFDPVKVAAPREAARSASPAPLAASGAPTSPEQTPVFNNCWSCRVLSGSGLIGAGGYVYWVARKPLKLGYPPNPGTVMQMVIGISESPGLALRGGRGEGEAGSRHVGGVAGRWCWPPGGSHPKQDTGLLRGSLHAVYYYYFLITIFLETRSF